MIDKNYGPVSTKCNLAIAKNPSFFFISHLLICSRVSNPAFLFFTTFLINQSTLTNKHNFSDLSKKYSQRLRIQAW